MEVPEQTGTPISGQSPSLRSAGILPAVEFNWMMPKAMLPQFAEKATACQVSGSGQHARAP
jgi:hypothetical protein